VLLGISKPDMPENYGINALRMSLGIAHSRNGHSFFPGQKSPKREAEKPFPTQCIYRWRAVKVFSSLIE